MITKHEKNIKYFLKRLKIYGEHNNIPNISEKNAEYIKKIIKERKIKNILEIGTANGYSSIQFATILKDIGGYISTIEFSQNAYEAAQKNIEISGYSGIIKQYYGDARDIMPYLCETYDMIFIDGLKKASLDFFLLAEKIIHKKGIIIIDDVIKFHHKMKDLYTHISVYKIPYRIEYTDEDDGIMIIEK